MVRSSASGNFASRAPDDAMLSVTRTFSVAEIQGLFVTPITVVKAPGAGKINIPFGMIVHTLSTGFTPYAAGGQLDFGWSGDPIYAIAAATDVTSATDKTSFEIKTTATRVADVAHINTDLVLTNETGAFTGGTGTTVTIEFLYFQI